MSERFDLVVIGGGSAGYAAASLAVRLGLRTAVIEGGEEIGGLCILRGCMPSKTILESANRLEAIRHAGEFGLRVGAHEPVLGEIIARKRRLVGEFADYRRQQLQTGNFEFIRGQGSFVDPHRVEVRGEEKFARTVEARSFLIATGSSLRCIDLPGLKETGALISDDVLNGEQLPRSIIVLGAGAVGMEFAHYYAALGVEVTVIQRSHHILSSADADIAVALTEAMKKRGVRFFLGTALRRVERAGDLKRVHFMHENMERSVEAEEILYALGRQPNLENLRLAAAGVEDGRQLANAHQQTNVPHIFAAGDVAGPFEIVHLAIQQGELAARNAAALLREGNGTTLETIDYRLKLEVVFTNPEVATLGMSERELMASQAPYLVAQYPFADHGKSMVLGETSGFVKLLAAEKSGEILGAAVVGAHASELIHEVAVAMHFKATARDLMMVPHYHPTLSEIWTYPAEELALQCEDKS